MASSSWLTRSADDSPPRARGPGFAARTEGRRSRNLPHARREHLLQPGEGVAEIALKGAARDRLQEISAEIERAQLGERETGLEPLEHLTVEPPSDVPLVIALIVKREACLLKRGQVAADGARGDVELVRECVDGHTVA